MLFAICVGHDTWVHHQNHIRRWHCSKATEPESLSSLSLDILLDTFAIPTDHLVSEPNAAAPSERKLLPRRRTNRVRRTTQPIQVNPRQKQY
ncbi:unnamed protein product [Schistocephalus solidus]|uniref:Uncharacterized protein n=1 Tax=Schistocephalus solidus TaxID=70667 RepID=A0A183TAQ3_SCHSO|nr:unnamed protein product [Schistocephalus solidus]